MNGEGEHDLDLDLDALMARVRAKAALGRAGGAPELPDETTFELHVADAAERNAARTDWPRGLRFFPFTAPALQRALLRLLARLSADRRAIDTALIAALRERARHDASVTARLAELEARIRALEARD